MSDASFSPVSRIEFQLTSYWHYHKTCRIAHMFIDRLHVRRCSGTVDISDWTRCFNICRGDTNEYVFFRRTWDIFYPWSFSRDLGTSTAVCVATKTKSYFEPKCHVFLTQTKWFLVLKHNSLAQEKNSIFCLKLTFLQSRYLVWSASTANTLPETAETADTRLMGGINL